MSDDHNIAQALAEARRSGHKLASYPGPTPRSKQHGFEIQTKAAELIGWQRTGWKVGCTSERAQTSLGTHSPFPGPLYRERLFRSGDTVPTDRTNSRVTEPEIAFALAKDLGPRERAYDVDDVLAGVASVHAAIEVVNPRLPKGFGDVIEWYVADGALNDAIVLGPPMRPLARERYREVRVTARSNGEIVGQGSGIEALGGPELVLTWLANELISKGMYLKAGDIISTGVIAGVFTSAPGERVEASFDSLGTVSVQF
jgi:2-keto-4-pentenoate hydratase